jgi:branched-chain amino acid transport system ATP-binding protein
MSPEEAAPRGGEAAPAVRARGLSAFFGPAQAVFGVDLEVAAGEVVALIGRNGAGKSATLKALMGLLRAAGAVELHGERIEHLPAYARARRGLGYVPEDRRIFTDLTVRQNLLVGARERAPDIEPLLRLFPNLREMLDRPAARMSGGEQQMLALARTLAARPRVLLLDEPSEGIAPILVEALAAAVLALKAQGLAVLLSEQNPRFVAAVADRALLLDRGHAAGRATIDEVTQLAPAVRAVLGL